MDNITQLFHDADALLYRNACAAQQIHYHLYYKGDDMGKVFRYKKDFVTYVKEQKEKDQKFYSVQPVEKLLDVGIAFSAIDKAIYYARKMTGAKKMEFFLTDENKSNFRYDLATILPYKGTRKQERPHYYHDCQKYLIDKWGAVIVMGEEADDAVCQAQLVHYNQLMSESSSDYDVTCIAHIDKDINMVPGWHYHYTDAKTYWVSELEGLRFFYTQMLTGDKQVDNIPGLHHITKKMATAKIKKVIQTMTTAEEMYDYVYSIFDKNKPDSLTVSKLEDDEVVPEIIDYPGTDKILLEIGNLLYMRKERGVSWSLPTKK